MTRFLAITVEPLSERLAGPAIRALELARAVARAGHQAALVSLRGCTRRDPEVELAGVTDAQLRDRVAGAQVVLVQGDVLGLAPWLAEEPPALVVDAYDPFHFEQLEQARALGETRRRAVVRDCVTSLNRQLNRADLVLAASGRQRDLWLGHLAALGRINPLTYDAMPDLSSLLTVVPFGVPADPPRHAGPTRMRGVLPGLEADAVIALWAGGLYDWFDPELVVRAVAAARKREPRLHLVLMGGDHPVLGGADSISDRLRTVAADLGVLDAGVHFLDRWIPYTERADWLLEADVGVVAHRPGIEADFAFRTRLLDHLWAGLPTIGCVGDLLTDRIAAFGAGTAVPVGDVAGYTAALLGLTSRSGREPLRTAARQMADGLRWDIVAAPLVAFCAMPRRAPDLLLDASQRALLQPLPEPRQSASRRVRAALAEGGPRLLVRRLWARLRRS